MDTISLGSTATAREIIDAAKSVAEGARISCQQEKHFNALKIALVKLNRVNVEVQLVDTGGYVIRNVALRSKKSSKVDPDELSDGQLRSVRSLEKALLGCQEQGLTLIGFSDSLVAIPNRFQDDLDALNSTAAMDVDTHGVYRGFEPDVE